MVDNDNNKQYKLFYTQDEYETGKNFSFCFGILAGIFLAFVAGISLWGWSETQGSINRWLLP